MSEQKSNTTTTTTTTTEDNKEHNVPLWFLAPAEEKTLLKEHQEWTEKQCETQYNEFAKCCKEFPLFFPWKCNEKKQAMIDCVGHYGSPQMFEKAKERYIERKIQFRKEKDEKEQQQQ